ncbi:MAG: hypothetical protein JOZ24_10655 [Candidatus Eremiobacteraeota bacterium]|nr:hypothetical protein [Candidatus Eremiobacteraeota bacterium]
MRAIAVLALMLAAAGCARSPDDALAVALRARLAQQYHDCLPLGWQPVVLPSGSYYPGYDASTTEEGVWLQALWIGTVRKRDLAYPGVARTQRVLDRLVRLGLLARIDLRDRARYHLTMRGAQYYYDDDGLGANVEHWPYLCFTRLVPERIAAQAGAGRATFTWHTDEFDDWMTPELRPYAIALAPTRDPAVAQVVTRSDGSLLAKLTGALPSVDDRGAWGGN